MCQFFGATLYGANYGGGIDDAGDFLHKTDLCSCKIKYVQLRRFHFIGSVIFICKCSTEKRTANAQREAGYMCGFSSVLNT